MGFILLVMSYFSNFFQGEASVRTQIVFSIRDALSFVMQMGRVALLIKSGIGLHQSWAGIVVRLGVEG